MPCFHPLQAFRSRSRTLSGKLGITFRISEAYRDMPVTLPCGQCIGCRLERSRQWAMRCMYESQTHVDNCFITLTYSDLFLPPDRALSKRDFQCFIKRLRRKLSPLRIRFFHCGEYGEKLSRPHYHALIFGYTFPDQVLYSDGANPAYTSEILDDLWGKGFSTVGALTFESAAYVARYAMKKITGDGADRFYESVNTETGEVVKIQSEYLTMSLKPAIGKVWYDRFSSDVFPSDFLIVNGKKVKPPKYFERLFDLENPAMLEAIKLRRIKKASMHRADSTAERLKVREQVVTAQVSQLVRHKEI